jgi:hypothetical protein
MRGVTVIAEVIAGFQLLLDEFFDDFIDASLDTDDGFDVFLSEQSLGSGAHPPCYDAVDTFIRQILGKKPGLVARVRYFFPIQYLSFLGFDNCVGGTAPEVGRNISLIR